MYIFNDILYNTYSTIVYDECMFYLVTASQTCQSECKVPSKRLSFFPLKKRLKTGMFP